MEIKTAFKKGDLVRITKRKCSDKVQPAVKVGMVFVVESTGFTKQHDEVLEVRNNGNTGVKASTLRINAARFDCELVSMEQLEAERREKEFRQEVKTDTERIMHAFTAAEHIRIAIVSLVLNECAFVYALKAVELGAQYRVSELKKLSRVTRQLRGAHLNYCLQDLKREDLESIEVQSKKFMQENGTHFMQMYFTVSNLLNKCQQMKGAPYMDMRIYAVMCMLIINYQDEYNAQCDELLRSRLGKIRASKRMPIIDSLFTSMDAYAGQISDFDWNNQLLTLCKGVLRNDLARVDWQVRDTQA